MLLKAERAGAGKRVVKRRSKRKVGTLLKEIQAADFIVFPTEILNSYTIEDDADDDEFEMQDGLEIVSHGHTSPAVEYWEPAARKRRAKAATTLRVARHRKTLKDKE